jgi:hypothetical protein
MSHGIYLTNSLIFEIDTTENIHEGKTCKFGVGEAEYKRTWNSIFYSIIDFQNDVGWFRIERLQPSEQ